MYLLFAFLLLLQNFKLDNLYLLFPIKTNSKSIPKYSIFTFNSTHFIKYYFKNEIYTHINIGNPTQHIIFNINMNDYLFYIGKGSCYDNSLSFYNYNKSTSFKRLTDFKYSYKNLIDVIYATESFQFYNDINMNSSQTFKNLSLILGARIDKSNNSYDYCGNIGFAVETASLNFTYPFFINQIKNIDNNINFIFSFVYITNTDQFLIVGTAPHKININKFNNKNLEFIDIDKKNNNNLEWKINFHKIYFEKNNEIVLVNEFFNAEIDININYIVCSNEYFKLIVDNYFNDYINNGVFKIENVTSEENQEIIYQVIKCIRKDIFTYKEMSKFPTLNFYSSSLDYHFTIGFENLFEEINNEIFFLIINEVNKEKENKWKLGKIFLKKYEFVFNMEEKSIGFYKPISKSSENNFFAPQMFLIFIFVIFGIFLFWFIFYLGRRYLRNKGKLNNKDLEDDFCFKGGNTSNYLEI